MVTQNSVVVLLFLTLYCSHYDNDTSIVNTVLAWRPSTFFPRISLYHSQYNSQIKIFQQQQQQFRTRMQQQYRTHHKAAARKMTTTPSDNHDDAKISYHDIVLFGIGDLRIDDHGGITNAIQLQSQQLAQTNNNNHHPIHCCVVLTDTIIQNICGIVAHTSDTINCIVSSIHELNDAISYYNSTTITNDKVNLGPLHCITSATAATAASKNNDISIMNYIDEYIHSLNIDVSNSKIRLHVCDLGPIDNDMGYNVYGQMIQCMNANNSMLNRPYEIIPWKNVLRTEPWDQVQDLNIDFPMCYPQYESIYTKKQPPLDVVNSCFTTDFLESYKKTNNYITGIPTAQQLVKRLKLFLPKDHNINDTANTGLYGTHYGGIASTNVGCQSVLQTLYHYCSPTSCNEDDTLFMNQQQQRYEIKYNPRSLEHAAMMWQLGIDGTESNSIKNTKNWLDGEVIIRYLLLPLYLGTVSSRRIWHISGRSNRLFGTLDWWNPPPLRTLVEGREWHNLLAARYFYDKQQSSSTSTPQTTVYRYWRYHGILCRYAQTDMVSSDHDNEKQGILLVHGFGASGTQWNKAMYEFPKLEATPFHSGLAPDLIGFGQSEKPALSYTGYMWDAQIMDFVKEIAIYKNRWSSFVIGGNSIGGYTSMSFAACDTATERQLSSSGSSGTRRCKGLVLMNSAGPIKTKEEVAQEPQTSSVAVRTSTFNLPNCQPPPRPVGRLFGNILLSYLRPNIQSICRNIYPTNPDAVDTALVYEIERDSLDPGAINVMMAGAKLPPPRTSNELLGAKYGAPVTKSNVVNNELFESYFDGPVLIAQGVLDPLNDAKDRMNRFNALRDGIDIAPINAGHCPHDELPYEIAISIANWTSTMITPSSSNSATNMIAVQRNASLIYQ